jgi:hypothetical protein
VRFRRAPGVLAAAAVLAVGLAQAAPGSADSFTPVRLGISVAPIARRAAALPITVTVSADPGVLDGSDGPVRIEVKLATECGATFETTPGNTLLDGALNPQPATGRAYTATAHGAGSPSRYGSQTICAFLEDTGAGRVYASDESVGVDVTVACTAAAQRYDRAARTLVRAERRLRRIHSARGRRRQRATIAAERRLLAHARAAGRDACGPGVAL